MWWYVPVALLVLFFPDGRLPGRAGGGSPPGCSSSPSCSCCSNARDPAPFPPPYEAAPHALGTWPPSRGTGARPMVAFALLPVAARAARRGRAGRWSCDPAQRRPGAAGAAALAGAGGGAPVPAHPAAVLDELSPARRRRPRARRPRADLLGLPAAATDRDPAPRPLRHRPPAVGDGHLRAGHRPAPGRLHRGGLVRGAAARWRLDRSSRPSHGARGRRASPRCAPGCSGGWTAGSTRLRWAALAAVDDLRARVDAGTARPEELQSVLATRVARPGAAGRLPAAGQGRPGRRVASAPLRARRRSGGAGARRVARRDRHAPAGGASLARAAARRSRADGRALSVEVVRLRSELGAALREVESSRARLLQAGYAGAPPAGARPARRRPAAAGLARHGAAARAAAPARRQVDVNGLLDQAVAELATAVAELRRIAHGLRPSSLDDGLGPALRRLASHRSAAGRAGRVSRAAAGRRSPPPPTTWRARPWRTPSSTPTPTPSRCGSRATRAGCRSGARRRPRRGDARSGSGLAGLTDRVAAAGGALQVRSAPGRGTLVEAVLPCAS